MQRIAVIGAGHAGLDFALRCVQSGFDVVLEDVMPSRLRHAEQLHAHSTPNLGAPSSRAVVSRAKVGSPHTSGTLHLATTVEEAVRSADLAVDFVPDELESKLEIFSLLDRMAPPRTILCTPTTALSITDLASCTYRPDRCFALQFPDPSHAKLLYTRHSAPETTSSVEAWLRKLGFTVTKERDNTEPMLVSTPEKQKLKTEN